MIARFISPATHWSIWTRIRGSWCKLPSVVIECTPNEFPVFGRHKIGSLYEGKTLADFVPQFKNSMAALEFQKSSPFHISRSLTIERGDVIVMYTDGVTEAINAQEEMFGEERLTEIIRNNARLPARVILEQILSNVKEFTVDMTQFDDITLLVIKGT